MVNLLKKVYRKGLLISMFCLIIVFGCARATGKIAAYIPEVDSTVSSKGKSVYLRSVLDNRLGTGKNLNSNVIGYKLLEMIKTPVGQIFDTNLTDGSSGQLLIENYENVSALVRDLIEYSLKKSGFEIADQETDNSIVMDAFVDKLWVSCEHGMMMKVYSKISVTVSVLIDGDKRDIEITSNEEKKFHIANDKKYRLIFNKALTKFENNAIELFSRHIVSGFIAPPHSQRGASPFTTHTSFLITFPPDIVQASSA